MWITGEVVSPLAFQHYGIKRTYYRKQGNGQKEFLLGAASTRAF